MLRLLEIILSCFYPTYWEVAVIQSSGESSYNRFFSRNDAEEYMESVMTNDTGNSVYVSMDKYINAHPHLLIKVNRHHKGWSSK